MSNEQTFTITVNGIKNECLGGTRISDAVSVDLPCGGHGRCGKCKVIARGALSPIEKIEKEKLSAKEIADGVRLACVARILGECELSTDLSKSLPHSIVVDARMPKFALSADFENFGIAIDIGTTTLAARLYTPLGESLAEATAKNPQSLLGADVISRIEASLHGKSEELRDLIRSAVDDIVLELCANAGVSAKEVDLCVITGNTTMLYLLTDTSPLELSRAPFAADRLFGEALVAIELGLSSLSKDTRVYIPPCISAFVGADTVCAILSADICASDESRMLIDIGTNGEISLWKDKKLFVCSTAAGPAFEGVGISCGMQGDFGAIDKVTIVNGSLFVHTLGERAACGICGSGILDALSCMLDLQYIDEYGSMDQKHVVLSEKVKLTQDDVRAVQLAKAAIRAGISTLAEKCEISIGDIGQISLAGGFGNYLNMHSAVKIGMLPAEMLGKIESVGNAALGGAAMLLLNSNLRAAASELARHATVVDLATDPLFADLYTSSMMF